MKLRIITLPKRRKFFELEECRERVSIDKLMCISRKGKIPSLQLLLIISTEKLFAVHLEARRDEGEKLFCPG
jgi:hypothetical protein